MSSFAAFRVPGALRQGGQVLHHSAPALLLSAACLCLVWPAYAGDGYVGIYADSLGTTPCATIPQSTGATLYVIAQTDGGTAGGITGAEFRIEVTNPSGWLLSYTSPAAASVVLGNPIDTDPDPDAGGGLNLAFPSCQTPTGSGQVRLGTIAVYNLSGSATGLLVKRHSQPSNTNFPCPLFVKCDDPYYTKLCMASATPDSCALGVQKLSASASGDHTVFLASLNDAVGDVGDAPRDADREVLTQFVRGVVQLPEGAAHASLASATIHSPAVESVLESYGVVSIAKAFPDFDADDAVAEGRSGKSVRLQDLSEIYALLLAESEDKTSLAQELASLIDDVVFAEPNGRAILHACPTDPYFSYQWPLHNAGTSTPDQSTCNAGADIEFCNAFAITPGNQFTKIAIMDTGVGPHDDLLGKVTGDDDRVTTAPPGHGTHVAGVAAANVNNSTGISGVDGLAQIISKFVSSSDSTASRLRAAAKEGASVFNNSWDHGTHPSAVLRGAFRDIYMLDRVAVVSMGNHGSPVRVYPAAFGQGIIAVGATDCQDQRWSDSGTGGHIDVAAPGVDVWSTLPDWVTTLEYGYMTGTSQAAPHVTGLAALLRGVNPELYNDDVEQLIKLSADDVNANVYPGIDSLLGAGRINARRALELLQFPNVLLQPVVGGGNAMDSTSQYTLKFFVPPDSSYGEGLYRVRRFEVRKELTFPVTFDSLPSVWGRGAATIGYSIESGVSQIQGNWNMGWCEPVLGTITPYGCTLRTFVYEVKSYPNGDQFIGWWPARHDSVEFAYSVLGTAPLTDSGDNNLPIAETRPVLSCANPVRRGTAITFSILQPGSVRIDLFDVAGRRIRVLRDGQFVRGRHEVRWDGLAGNGTSLAAGLYLVRLESEGQVATRKLVVLE